MDIQQLANSWWINTKTLIAKLILFLPDKNDQLNKAGARQLNVSRLN